MSWFWLIFAILFEVAATLSLRASDGLRKRKWLVPIVTGYVLAFVFLGFSLGSGMPVGIAYGLWTAIGIVFIAVFARVVWKEPLTRRMLIGIGCIAFGVMLIEVGSGH